MPVPVTTSPAYPDPLLQAVGTSYFQCNAKLVHVVLRRGHALDIKTTPMITLTSGLMVKEDEFHEQNLVLNLADLFEVSPNNIRVISVIRENSKRQQGKLEVGMAEVASAPSTTLNGEGEEGATGGEVIPYEKLVQSLEKAVSRFQDGSCSNCASLLVKCRAILQAAGEGGASAEKIKESLAVTEYAKPSSALVLSGVSSSVVQYTVFEIQLSVTVLDKEGVPTSDLGHKSDPWQVTASLLGGLPGAILMGTTTVPYRNGATTFTDLSVSKPGEGYNLSFTITYPSCAPALTTTLEETFSISDVIVGLLLASPQIDTDECSNDPAAAQHSAGQTAHHHHFVDKDSGLVLNGLAFKSVENCSKYRNTSNRTVDFPVVTAICNYNMGCLSSGFTDTLGSEFIITLEEYLKARDAAMDTLTDCLGSEFVTALEEYLKARDAAMDTLTDCLGTEFIVTLEEYLKAIDAAMDTLTDCLGSVFVTTLEEYLKARDAAMDTLCRGKQRNTTIHTDMECAAGAD
ncbi:hypothetical protein O3P69_014087 [Scylla paramamosain]|uniref:Uncharacterized protein n=1 Tax=Scylla paramamosain TaxID=85552 RepID=A0AAW0SSB8_SCYPA